ncbi:hypothetical protein ENBRE01_2293 [Enteropsectra breve]|nr:hypothetical protein ENBRE01_2293 [Enteropsectra breve]
MIMIATTIAGENKGFISGFGISPAKNLIYWTRFIQFRNEALSLETLENLIIISDRDKGLQHAVDTILPCAFDSFCIPHIERNIKSRISHSCPQIWSAAKESTVY